MLWPVSERRNHTPLDGWTTCVCQGTPGWLPPIAVWTDYMQDGQPGLGSPGAPVWGGCTQRPGMGAQLTAVIVSLEIRIPFTET